MVTLEECSCTDTTEPSNLTSLRSDTVNSDVNALSETLEKGDDAEEPKDVNRKRSEVLQAVDYFVPATTEPPPAIPPDRQRDNPKSATTQFRSCLCRTHKINGYVLPVKLAEDKSRSRQFWSRFSLRRPRKGYLDAGGKMYEIKLKQTPCPHYAKVRLSGAAKQQDDAAAQPPQAFACRQTSNGIPSKSANNPSRANQPPKYPTKPKPKKEELAEKIEIYYFDHGSCEYYRTTDCHPVLATDRCAEKTDQAAIRFWAEIFGTIHIGIAFVTAFILQLLRFVLYSLVRPLTVGVVQMIADYFVKPLLSILFNGLIQPVLILLYNVATSLRDLCEPIAEAMGLFLREIANLCAAIRLVEVKHVHTPSTAAYT